MAASSAFGQIGDSPQLRFRHLTIEDGLSQTSVYAIVQDQRGLMWLGTQDGLNRYDGRHFVTYRQERAEPNSISDSFITALYLDGQGRLWIGTRRGLNLYDRDRDTFIRHLHDPNNPMSLSDDSVTAIHQDPDGALWIGTEGGGLNRWMSGARFTRYGHDALDVRTLSSNTVTSILSTDSHGLWVGTSGGLDFLHTESGRIERVSSTDSHDGLPNARVTALTRDPDRSVWVGTTVGLFSLDPTTRNTTHRRHHSSDPSSLSDDRISALVVDRRGDLWVGTRSSGLNRLDRESDTFVRYGSDPIDEHALHDNLITTFFEDESGLLWVGTESVGAELAETTSIRLFRHHPLNERTLSSSMAWDFREGLDGSMWVATRAGLNLLDPISGIVTRYSGDRGNPVGLGRGTVRALDRDRADGLWAGVTDGGLYRLDESTGHVTHYRHDPSDRWSLADDSVLAVLVDSSGHVWVGTRRGLSRLDPGTNRFRTYRHDPSDPRTLGANHVRRVYEDSAHRIWIGTRDGGLNRYDRRTDDFVRYQHDPERSRSLGSDKVWSILEDRRGRLWVGTLGGGLHQFDPTRGQFTQYTTKHGLSNNVVYGILEDDDGALWLSTNDGLSKFDPDSRTFTNFDRSHGLQGKEFNSGAFFKDSRGRLWFGGLTGVNVVDPAAAWKPSFDPRVVLTAVTVANEPVRPGIRSDGHAVLDEPATEASVATFTSTDRVIGFEFSTLDFALPGFHQYRYRLEGFDDEWNFVGDRGQATYTNLPPGRYRFRASGMNRDRVWSPREALIDVVVIPPFWRTWWFSVLTTSVMAFGVALGFKIRTRSIRAANLRLQDLVAEGTATIEAKKDALDTAIANLAEARGQITSQAHAAGMAEIVTGVLHNIGNLQNSISVSCAVIRECLERSKLSGFARANALLRQHRDSLETFLTHDKSGQQLPAYYFRLEELLVDEHRRLREEASRLGDKVAAVEQVIAVQQQFACGTVLREEVSLSELIERTLILEDSSLEAHDVSVRRAFGDVPAIVTQKSKLAQVLLNLITNAKDALKATPRDRREITIELRRDDHVVEIRISDNGCGIKPADLDRMFTYGFTTKAGGHGFGLHSSANYMTELGGTIRAESGGEGCGATFVVSLPCPTSREASAAA